MQKIPCTFFHQNPVFCILPFVYQWFGYYSQKYIQLIFYRQNGFFQMDEDFSDACFDNVNHSCSNTGNTLIMLIIAVVTQVILW